MWSYCRRPSRYLSWISVHYSVSLLILSNSITNGQIPEVQDDYLEDGFIPTFGPHGGTGRPSRSFPSNGLIGDGGFGSGDLQSNFLALFDWTREMPAIDIVNTFLDNEDELPILKELQDTCPKSDFFYGANPSHMSAVMKIKKLLMEQNSPQDAILMAATLRDKREVNPNAWFRGVMSAALYRPDLQGLRKPAMVEVMPSMLLNSEALEEMKRQGRFGPGRRTCVPVDGSVGSDNGVENILWYWREDLMLNSHHWYWHLSYPLTADEPRQDRRGELFAFMHHTFLARYHAERLAHNLPPTLPLNLQRGTVLREPYNPHLTDTNSGRNWAPRPANVPISDTMSNALPGAPFFVSVDNRTVELSRILESISLRTLLDAFRGQTPIDNLIGIDLLGDVVEASGYSINPEYYGFHGFHNAGHVLISLALDPVQELNLPPGVMGDPGTAMRDVIFYPYHTFVDDIFEAHKRTLPPYQLSGGDWPLVWDGVELLNVKVQSPNLPTNNLQTFWGERRFDLSRGLDFNRSTVAGPIWTCVRHLDHQDFEYHFTVDRKEFVRAKRATFRVFLAPRYDEKGRRYMLEEQRRRFFIMDKFTVILNPGINNIVRNSAETSLTVDFPQSYRELQQDNAVQTPACGCGWPHHLLVPKGTPQGMVFDLFVMITNGKKDFVPSSGRPPACRSAPIFCGVVGERYPDARPIGYPFDRPIYQSNNINPLDPTFDDVAGPITLGEWVGAIPNMATTKIAVTHVNQLRGGVGAGPVLGQFNGDGIPDTDAFVGSHLNGLQNFGSAPSASLESTSFNNVLPPAPAGGDFFTEFFPSTRPANNHPKRFAPSIETPAKEFMELLYG